MSTFTLFVLTAVGDGLISVASLVHAGCALADGKPWRAAGWLGWVVGAAILSVAFATRAWRL